VINFKTEAILGAVFSCDIAVQCAGCILCINVLCHIARLDMVDWDLKWFILCKDFSF